MFWKSLYHLYTIGVEPAEGAEKFAHLELDPKGKICRLLLTSDEKAQLPFPGFFGKLSLPLVACATKAADCLVRSLSLPLKKRSAITSALPFQVEPLLPYPVEEASLGWSLLESDEKSSSLSVTIVPKERVEKVEQRNDFSKTPAVFAPQAALSTFLSHFFSQNTPILSLHFSSDETFALLQEGKKLVKAASLPHALDPFSSEDAGAIQQLLFSLLTKSQSAPALLCTGHKESEKAAEFLAKKFDLPLCSLTSLNGINTPQQELLQYAVAIGLALAPFHSSSCQLQGKQKSVEALFQEWKIPLTFSFSASLLLTVAIGFSLYREGITEMKSVKTQIEATETLLIQNGFSLPYQNDSLSPQVKLEKLKAYLPTLPKTIPLSSDFPPPSAVLKWLSEHPVVTSSWETPEVGISLESFRYMTVEKPEEGRKNRGYKVKVEVEILSPSNVLARQFHDTLLQPNSFINSKEEVRWSAKGDLYQASFFLQPKAKLRKKQL